MKPTSQFAQRKFPPTDCFFHAGFGEWGRAWSEDDEEPRPRNLAQQYLIESARERAKEMWVFGAVVIASAWPVIYMMVIVIKLLFRGRSLA